MSAESGKTATSDRVLGDDGLCESRIVLEHITSRWGVLVLIELLDRPHRFSELRRAVGRVSEKMLAQTLQTLERDGMVHREARPVVPPHVVYSLTPMGREAGERVFALSLWVYEHMDEVTEARTKYDSARR
jgi:DNA-binding HxlR family transcriptional regulator